MMQDNENIGIRFHNFAIAFMHPINLMRKILDVENTNRRYHYLKEIFVEQEYKELYNAIKPNTIVLDLGASIGDTAIYFAMNPNVKLVYSYEPVPKYYREAKQNIKNSRFENKIKLFNEGVGPEENAASIGSNYEGQGAVEPNTNDYLKQGKMIYIRSLNNILNKKEKVVIKCDIEGIEKTLFDNVILYPKVYALQIEFHNCAGNVIKVLTKQGFKTYLTKHRDTNQGIIFAWR